VATKNALRNDWKAAKRQKRGGGAFVLSLDCADAEQRCVLDAIDDESPDRIFDRHWGINLLQRTMDRLEVSYAGRGQADQFAALKSILGQSGTGVRYQDLAEQLGISESAVKVAAHRLRKRFRGTLKEEIALTLDEEGEEAIEEEIRFLFGVFAR
jgi:DNA-directed RNA polymerase specialized sigma24 family protein